MPSACLPLCDDITIPHKASLNAHNSMYRRRAKLRDILRIVDRHNTGVLSRPKFHMCLQLADLPRPDRKTDQNLYGAYYTKESFRYGDFLESLKYDTSYRNRLMAQWRQLLGESTARMPGHPVSQTPDPRPPPGLMPASRGLGPPGSRGLSLPALSRGSQRQGSNWGAVRSMLQSLDRGGTVSVEQLQDTLMRSQMQPVPAANDQLMDMLRSFDKSGKGDIDYNGFLTTAQQMEGRGQPLFRTGGGDDSCHEPWILEDSQPQIKFLGGVR